MHNRKPREGRSRIRGAAMMLEMACHTAMGIALGLVFSFALACIDRSALAVLIAQGRQRAKKTGTALIAAAQVRPMTRGAVDTVNGLTAGNYLR